MAAKTSKNKLWQARFNESSSEILNEFNSSLSFDIRLFKEDIETSQVHAKMLSKQKIISKQDAEQIEKALQEIEAEIENDIDKWLEDHSDAEDIHMAIEAELTKRIGDAGKKLHTARSRNDQVVTDLKLWLKKEINEQINLVKKLRQAFVDKAKEDIDIILPGYTHLQQAQAISLAHFWLAYEVKLERDQSRLEDCLKRVDLNPLGSGALAGTSYSIDREFTTKELGFKSMTTNSLDAVSDRDYVCEYEFCLSLLMLHLSSFAEEMITWNSQEFSFIEISDAFATGSSMMPQKKNPDIPELIRGKTGRVIGVMNAMLITIKSLPLSYNKDLQEDKEQLFMVSDTVKKCLTIAKDFLLNIKAKEEKMLSAVENSYTAATDIADYLVKKGMAFRDAYVVVGELVNYCISREIYFNKLSIEDLKLRSELFDDDVFELLKAQNMVDSRDIPGGTSRKQIKSAIAKINI
jgi:argininosuccinate lyase